MNQPINETDPDFDKIMEIVWKQEELPNSITIRIDLTFDQVMERYGEVLTEKQIKIIKNYARQ